jgi:hypothetical protein
MFPAYEDTADVEHEALLAAHPWSTARRARSLADAHVADGLRIVEAMDDSR